jgi:hypothetical protein
MRGRPFRKGVSGNPGGRPKAIADIRELARAHSPEAIKELARLSVGAKSEAVRVMAIRELLDRGFGKSTWNIAPHDRANLDTSTAAQLREEVLGDFARVFPEYRVISATDVNGPEQSN